jgi:hypothetical protein
MKVNYVILDNSLVLNFEGKTISIHASDSRFVAIKLAIAENNLEQIPAIVDVDKKYSAKDISFINNEVLVDGKPVHESIAMRLQAFKAEDLPTDNLVKFVRKLRLNPSFNSREQLFKFIEHNGHPITTEGNFIAYRGVTEDFKDMHTKTFDNSPGSVCEVSRTEVDDNPNNTCSFGLHVACFAYAKDFGRKLVEVEVDPKDVVCVPTDYNGTKMRVSKFKVVGVVDTMNTSVLVKSSYPEVNAEFITDENDYDDNEDETEEDWENYEDSDNYNPSKDNYVESKWVDVNLLNSSFIVGAKYNKFTKDLVVTLTGGLDYTYYDIEASVITAWENALSVGSFFNKHIKNS